MSFLNSFESKKDGIEDTIEFTIRLAVATLACVVLVVILAMVVGLFVSDDVVSNDKIFDILGPAFNTVIGAFVGLLGGLSLNANARDAEPSAPSDEPDVEPGVPVGVGGVGTVTATEPMPLTEVYADPAGTVVVQDDDDDDDDDLAPWEKYRNDLRYDINGDGVVDENDFPDWRNPAQ